MNPTEILQSAIAQRSADLAVAIPADRTAATVALVRAVDELSVASSDVLAPDPFTGIPVPGLGNSRAFQLILESPMPTNPSPVDPDAWATTFLDACQHLARAELVLSHTETGFMRLLTDERDHLEARIAQGATSVRWQERVDDAWWASWLAERHPLPDAEPHARARALIDRSALRYDLPERGCIGSVDLDLARRVLAALVMFAERDGRAPIEQATFLAQLVTDTGASEVDVAAVVGALTLDASNTVWHAAVPGVVDPPLVRLPDSKLVVSRRGVCHDPFRFLTRELRRRDPEAYHSAATYREHAFRSDLYDLFSHRRFVTSPGSIELRREKGSIRTDIDAAVFDRKSGTLALFELKTNEPFARSTAELTRARENARAGGRQMANVLDWINRHGADEILNRIDRRTAKGFRVQKVQAFVLGRHVIDGDDRRAVWATWPQLLRVLGRDSIEDIGANPIVALAGRLSRDQPLMSPRDVREPVIVELGGLELVVRPLR